MRVVNPLSVSIYSSGKKSLILKLKYVNMHLYKGRIKFDYWKCFENYLLANKGYLFKFDLKNGCHDSFVFTKVVHALVKHWCLHVVKSVRFLDNGLGIAYPN